jgi:hypothetical protein
MLNTRATAINQVIAGTMKPFLIRFILRNTTMQHDGSDLALDRFTARLAFKKQNLLTEHAARYYFTHSDLRPVVKALGVSKTAPVYKAADGFYTKDTDVCINFTQAHRLQLAG